MAQYSSELNSVIKQLRKINSNTCKENEQLAFYEKEVCGTLLGIEGQTDQFKLIRIYTRDTTTGQIVLNHYEDVLGNIISGSVVEACCGEEIQRMKVSDYLHINSDIYADITPLSYKITSWVINGNETITTPIVSPTYSNSNVILVAVQSPPYNTIPDYNVATCDVDTLFYTFLNQAASALGLSTYSFRESPLMHGDSNHPNPYYHKDYDRNLDNITPHPYYGCGFQIVRPMIDTFSIVVECYYNGVYGHIMEFTETQCIINGITTAGVPTNGNVF